MYLRDIEGLTCKRQDLIADTVQIVFPFMIKKAFISLSILISGCSSCMNNFYGTNSHAYLSIDLEDTTINYSTLAYYIDSVLNKGIHFPDSIKSKFYINSVQTDLHEDNRLIHFKEHPEEWYLIEFQGSPCIIDAIYNARLSINPIFDRGQLGEAQVSRIRMRVKMEIFHKANLYAKENHIFDSSYHK